MMIFMMLADLPLRTTYDIGPAHRHLQWGILGYPNAPQIMMPVGASITPAAAPATCTAQ